MKQVKFKQPPGNGYGSNQYKLAKQDQIGHWQEQFDDLDGVREIVEWCKEHLGVPSKDDMRGCIPLIQRFDCFVYSDVAGEFVEKGKTTSSFKVTLLFADDASITMFKLHWAEQII